MANKSGGDCLPVGSIAKKHGQGIMDHWSVKPLNQSARLQGVTEPPPDSVVPHICFVEYCESGVNENENKWDRWSSVNGCVIAILSRPLTTAFQKTRVGHSEFCHSIQANWLLGDSSGKYPHSALTIPVSENRIFVCHLSKGPPSYC